MTPLQALAPRPSTTVDTVQELLGTLVSRYRTDELMTAVRQIPARKANLTPMPDWVRSALSEAYRAKGITQLYSHDARPSGFCNLLPSGLTAYRVFLT